MNFRSHSITNQNIVNQAYQMQCVSSHIACCCCCCCLTHMWWSDHVQYRQGTSHTGRDDSQWTDHRDQQEQSTGPCSCAGQSQQVTEYPVCTQLPVTVINTFMYYKVYDSNFILCTQFKIVLWSRTIFVIEGAYIFIMSVQCSASVIHVVVHLESSRCIVSNILLEGVCIYVDFVSMEHVTTTLQCVCV